MATNAEVIAAIRDLSESLDPMRELVAHHEDTLFHGNGDPPLTRSVAMLRDDIQQINAQLTTINQKLGGINEVKTELRAHTEDRSKHDLRFMATNKSALVVISIMFVTFHEVAEYFHLGFSSLLKWLGF